MEEGHNIKVVGKQGWTELAAKGECAITPSHVFLYRPHACLKISRTFYRLLNGFFSLKEDMTNFESTQSKRYNLCSSDLPQKPCMPLKHTYTQCLFIFWWTNHLYLLLVESSRQFRGVLEFTFFLRKNKVSAHVINWDLDVKNISGSKLATGKNLFP